MAARWARQEKLGKGAFGIVWRVVRESGGGPTEVTLKVETKADVAGQRGPTVWLAEAG